MSVCRKAPRRRKRLNLEEGVRSGPSREVLYPLHSRHRPAGNNTAYLGDGARL